MNKSFTYMGQKYINGYACDSMGRPITIKNGYSSEDEKDAKEAYEDALKAMGSSPVSSPVSTPAPKYTKKIELVDENGSTAEDIEELKKASRYHRNGHLLNDAGEEISLENGYTDEDVKQTRHIAKRIQKNGRYY